MYADLGSTWYLVYGMLKEKLFSNTKQPNYYGCSIKKKYLHMQKLLTHIQWENVNLNSIRSLNEV